jgi:hypothetical protein
MASGRRDRLEAWMAMAAETLPEQGPLTAAIDELQSEIWMELADLEELFDALNSTERALQAHLQRLDGAG